MYGADKDLASFLYVNNRNEVADRIRAVRDDSVARKEIVDSSYNVLGWNKQEYSEQLVDVVKSVLANHK
jgi:hypothetical protein